MPVINTVKVSTALVFVNEMMLEGFCPNCSIDSVSRTLNLNKFERALLTDVITIVSIERGPTIPLHRHLTVVG